MDWSQPEWNYLTRFALKDSLNLNRGHLVPFIVVLLTEFDFGVLPELRARLWTNGIVDGDALLSLNKGTSNGT